MKTMHLFAGVGGGLLADLILGHEPIVAVEWDAYCCQVLRERAADGWFRGLRVHEGDIRLFDPSEYAGRVDCIHAGFPCQDVSLAGNRAGLGEGTRSGLYREVLRIAGILRPRYLFLENVSAILSSGLGRVLGDLAALGYDCRWTCLPASAAGAPHYRDRWWCLAHAEHPRVEERRRASDSRQKSDSNRGPISSNERPCCEQQATEILAHPQSQRCSKMWGDRCQQSEERPTGGCEDVADADRQRLEESQYASVCTTGGREKGGTTPKFGWWQSEPDVCRVAHGVASRVDRLKALGNGQVPLQAAVAWRLLGGP